MPHVKTSRLFNSFAGPLAAMMLLVIFVPGCGSSGNSDAEKKSSKSGTSNSDKARATKSTSRPQVLGEVAPFSLIDQNGTPFTEKQLKGKVWVATFIFTRCPLTCPLQSRWMAKLQQRLTKEPTWPDLHLVSFSVDPTYDTAEVLKKYASDLKADDAHWHFLTGTREDIWKLSKDSFHLPVAESPGAGSLPIVHDPRVALIDREGKIRGYFDVVSDDSLEPILKAMAEVLPEFQPTSDQWPHDSATEPRTHLAQPPEILNTDAWLSERTAQQKEVLAASAVAHNFQLTNSTDASGITFRNQILDEQRSRLQVNHFDHGNGLCTADIDNDGLQDLYFVNQAGLNALYRNLGNGKFEDITETAGVAVPGRIKVSASFADVNNDGRSDLFVTTVRGGNLLFLNEGEGRFTDVTEAFNVGYSGHSSSAAFFDYNRDGYLDLYVTNVGKYTTDEEITVRADLTTALPKEGVKYFAGMKDAFAGHLKPELNETSILYRNEAGKGFVDVSAEMGIEDTGWSGGAIPLDANEDGWIDLHVLNMQGADSYYENQQGTSFVKKTDAVFPQTPWGAMGGRAFDFDNDGHQDLMLTDMHSDMSETVTPDQEKLKSNMQWPESFLKSDGKSIYGNAFYRNLGEGKFSEISDDIGAENFWPWGMSTGDINADGFEDVLISGGMCFPYRYSANSLLLNDAGKRFLDSENVVGLEPRQDSMLIPWFELNCDGEDKDNPICRNRSGKLVVWSAPGSRSSLLLDLDNDGDLDVVTNDFNTRPQILMSSLAEQNTDLRYLRIRLVGTKSNRDGLGSRVTVTTKKGSLHQVHDGQSGYLSQSTSTLYFGLAGESVVDQLTVVWPSGKTQVLEGPIQAQQQIDITEPVE